jgi:hypothetical protein
MFLTRYLLPIAQLNENMVGIHLLPSHVRAKRFLVADFDPEGDRLIEAASSLRGYVHRYLFEEENDCDNDVAEELAVARDVFGSDFYQQASQDEGAAGGVCHHMIERFGGAALDYREAALEAKARKATDEQLEWLRRGSEAAPECMEIHCTLAELHARQGDQSAAESFVRSLGCHHHTARTSKLSIHYALGRELLAAAPAAFSDRDRNDLALAGEERLEWIVSLFEAGKLELSLKLLADFRYDSKTDMHPALLDLLRLHYERLGWTWARAWCELCAVDQDHGKRVYTHLERPLGPGWDQPVRRVLGSR